MHTSITLHEVITNNLRYSAGGWMYLWWANTNWTAQGSEAVLPLILGKGLVYINKTNKLQLRKSDWGKMLATQNQLWNKVDYVISLDDPELGVHFF